MDKVSSLEALCIKSLLDNNPFNSKLRLPPPMIRKMEIMKIVNGRYKTEDDKDMWKFIEINYDGDALMISFEAFANENKITLDFSEEIPVRKVKEVFYLVDLDEQAIITTTLSLQDQKGKIEMKAMDKAWKWELILDIR